MSHVSDICIHTHTQEYLRAEHAARFEVGCVVTVQNTFTWRDYRRQRLDYGHCFGIIHWCRSRLQLTEGTKGELLEIEKHYFKIKWQEGVTIKRQCSCLDDHEEEDNHEEEVSALYVRKSEALNMTCPAAQVRMYSMFGVLCFLFHLEFSKIHPIP